MGLMDLFGQSPDDYQQPLTVDDLFKSVERRKPVVKKPMTSISSPSDNPLRPTQLKDFIGQQRAKRQVGMFIAAAKGSNKTFPHTLLATGSGMGKTTLATIIAAELGRNIFWEKAPISIDRLLTLMSVIQDGDILVLDEVHLQDYGRVAGNRPEVLYDVMEDRKIRTEQGLFDFPEITVIGCTTHRGNLPRSFTDRFDCAPVIEPYSDLDMGEVADLNARQLKVEIDEDARDLFAHACQWTPRVMNKFIKQAAYVLEYFGKEAIDIAVAENVLDNQSIERDGLTYDHMKYLQFLVSQQRYMKSQEEWVARASIKTITLGMGINDQKYVQNDIEPLLIRMGFLRIASARELTDEGFERLGLTRPIGPL